MHILLVEDDDLDTEAFRRVLNKNKIGNPLHTACDGEAALDILKSSELRQPCLIFLDINMPRMNGFQFLEEMRKNASMKNNVVFMLTTSPREEDKVRAYGLNAAGYILKEDLTGLGAMLSHYCQINQIPAGDG